MDTEYWKHREFIEFCFRREGKIKRAIYEKRNDPNRPLSAGHGSGISKPTEIEAINRAMPLLCVTVDGKNIPYPEAWVRAIAYVKAHYNYRQGGILYKLRYNNIPDLTRAEIMQKMGISKTRYHQLIIEIIDFAMNHIVDKMYNKERV